MTLPEFLSYAASRRFSWPDFNCLLWLGAWMAEVRGADPVAHLVGRFPDERTCMRYVARQGGIVRLVNSVGAAGGFKRVTDGPQAGDVGVVRALGPRGRWRSGGALCVGSRGWAVLTHAGLAVGAPRAVLTAWRG